MNFLRAFPLLLAAALAVPAAAAELSLEAPLASAESAFFLPVVFESESEDVNVVEGSIRVPEDVDIESIDTSASSFAVFAHGPVYDLSSRTITFAAGAPGGLAGTDVALLFVIRAHASVPGTYVFEPGAVTAYRNDGSGTAITVAADGTALSVGEKGSVAVDPLPKAPAVPLIAEIGRDASLFEGRWFATFFGGASGSSVAYYEVREGWLRPAARADRYYVLEDQGRGSTIWVTAVGEGGERATVTLPAENPWSERALIALAALVLLALAWLLFRRLRRPRV